MQRLARFSEVVMTGTDESVHPNRDRFGASQQLFEFDPRHEGQYRDLCHMLLGGVMPFFIIGHWDHLILQENASGKLYAAYFVYIHVRSGHELRFSVRLPRHGLGVMLDTRHFSNLFHDHKLVLDDHVSIQSVQYDSLWQM